MEMGHDGLCKLSRRVFLNWLTAAVHRGLVVQIFSASCRNIVGVHPLDLFVPRADLGSSIFKPLLGSLLGVL